MKQALKDFEISLARIDRVVQEVVANTARALADPIVREIHETHLGGAVVLMVGHFEVFLRDVVRGFTESVANRAAYMSLPAKIRERHFEGGGDVLTKVAKAQRTGSAGRWQGIRQEDVATRIASVLVPSPAVPGSYSILWEAFADTQANPSSRVVKDILGRLDVGDAWRLIQSKAIAAKPPAANLLPVLDSLIEMRNECAHTGRPTQGVTASAVTEYLEALRAIASAICEVLEDQLASRY